VLLLGLSSGRFLFLGGWPGFFYRLLA